MKRSIWKVPHITKQAFNILTLEYKLNYTKIIFFRKNYNNKLQYILYKDSILEYTHFRYALKRRRLDILQPRSTILPRHLCNTYIFKKFGLFIRNKDKNRRKLKKHKMKRRRSVSRILAMRGEYKDWNRYRFGSFIDLRIFNLQYKLKKYQKLVDSNRKLINERTIFFSNLYIFWIKFYSKKINNIKKLIKRYIRMKKYYLFNLDERLEQKFYSKYFLKGFRGYWVGLTPRMFMNFKKIPNFRKRHKHRYKIKIKKITKATYRARRNGIRFSKDGLFGEMIRRGSGVIVDTKVRFKKRRKNIKQKKRKKK